MSSRYRSLLTRGFRRCFSLRYQIRSKSGFCVWEKDLTTDIKTSIENHWKSEVLEQPARSEKDTQYILSMFPYPSGQLHMGHVRVYSLSDTVARFHRLNGKHVIHPMGWDAFGLPAENAALERKVLPENWTASNIKIMKEQLLQLGFTFDWNRELMTCKPDYYKWTQFIFLKLFENDLAYQSKGVVNWDPVDKTVLADEQVDENGCSWRSGARVEKKLLKQWFIKTTKYAKALFDNLNDETLIDWRDIINLQKHWIGDCNGISVKFDLKAANGMKLDTIDIWTSKPEKIAQGQFIATQPDSMLCKEITSNAVEKMILPVVALNPINGKELPIIVTEAVEYPEGRDVYIASPNTCKQDLSLALQLNLPVCNENFNNDNIESKNYVIETVQKKNIGVYPVSSKLKDWLISRQRYWGTPIPIIHCEACGPVPVPYCDLPVELPKVESITPGVSPLSDVKNWLNCVCPKCGDPAQRETDTMDTFVDSSWYFFRYLDPCNEQKPFDADVVNSSFPVNLYIGGKEHAVLHLYYARFMTHFFHSLKWTSHPEPFKRLLVQGMVMGKSYRVKSSGKYLPFEKVRLENDNAYDAETGEILEVQWEKMSKSKSNGVNPQNLLKMYGCDTTRLFMLADVTPPTHRHWSDATFPGILNWQKRLWLTMRELLEYRKNEKLDKLNDDDLKKHEDKLWETRNYFVARTTYNYNYLYNISVAISRLQALSNSLRRVPPEVVSRSKEYELALSSLIIMLSPVAPHFSCELWAGLQSAPNRRNVCSAVINWNAGVLEQNWPRVDENYKLSLICKVDGTPRAELKMVPKELESITHDVAVKLMLDEKNVAKRLRRGISHTEFSNLPGCGATLNVLTIQVQPKQKKDYGEVSSKQ